MRLRPLALACLLAAVGAADVQAQALDGVMATIRNGGGWVSIPIEDGTGTASTIAVPTMGITLNACLNVWEGHTGTWTIRGRDTIAGDTLELKAEPGEGVRFSHTFGLRTQLEVEFRWSEARDTTLFLWVGVDGGDPDRDACTPKT